jgi:hypothetical protein
VDSVHNTERERGCSYRLHNPSRQGSRPGQRERKQQVWHNTSGIKEVCGQPPPGAPLSAPLGMCAKFQFLELRHLSSSFWNLAYLFL